MEILVGIAVMVVLWPVTLYALTIVYACIMSIVKLLPWILIVVLFFLFAGIIGHKGGD